MGARWLALLAGMSLSCAGEERARVEVPSFDACHGLADQVLCTEGLALTCLRGTVIESERCADRGLTCAAPVGCRACEPNTTACEGQRRLRCNADGSALTLVEECASNLSCAPSGCLDLCAQAASDRSYLGCDYWPVFTSNSELPVEFKPAVAIGNGNLVPAHVVITRNQQTVAELDVAPSSASTLELDAVQELKAPRGSRLVRGGAYHLVSSVPVTVHQFNPLYFELPADCTVEPERDKNDGRCFSYTNDASLLFPSTALAPDLENKATSVDFYALSRASYQRNDDGMTWRGLPGFVAISAVGNATVHVRITSTARTQASPIEAPDALPALNPNDVLERDLAPGDVLQLTSALSDCSQPEAVIKRSPITEGVFCDPGASFDLTGTRITADGAIQVISGHDCSNVPFDRSACDHLDESMPPLSTWGTTAVLAVPRASAGSQYYARIFSGSDNNQVSFDPPLHEPVTLARGQWLELNGRESVVVKGSGRFLIGQYLVGANRQLILGDPSLSIAVPVDQWRQSYDFSSPATYTQNVIDIVATDDGFVTLDGKLVTDFARVGASRFRVASLKLEQPGAHQISTTSSAGLGISLYGLGSYTSYMLPGGLDLDPLVFGF